MSNRSRRTVVAEVEPGFLQSCMTKWSKGLRKGAKWDKETFEDFPVCVHWFRQIVAAAAGVTLGFLGITGAPGVVGGFGFVTGVTYLYYSGYVEADEMSYGENGLKMEGLLPSFTVFLLSWIVTFTAKGHAAIESA
ncbi:unnamed protein product [Hapterophycus canaliculatus]